MNSLAKFRALAALALATLAACADGGPTDLTNPPPPPEVNPERPNHVPPPALFDSVYAEAVLTCNATVSPASIACGSPQGPAAGPFTVGGKGTHVRMITASPSYNATTDIFQANARFQNLMVNRMGTADGPTTRGLMAFVMAAPVTTGGSGTVTVNNADSTGTFTAANQPYFFYDTVLAVNQATVNRLWRFNVPGGVTSFQFKVYISAPLLPIVVFDKDDAGNRDIWRVALDGSDLVRLTNTAGPDVDPTVANGRVVFVGYRAANAELYSVSLMGGSVTRLTITPTVNETAPAVSLDGTKLAFVSDAGSVAKIWMGAFDGTTLTNMAPVTGSFSTLNAIENAPAWDRSSRIAFVTTIGPTSDIFYYTIGGGLPTDANINSDVAPDVEPTFTHNGLRIAWTTTRDGGDAEIYLRQTSTVRATTRAGVDAQPTYLSDNKLVWVEDGTPSVLRWANPGVTVTGTIPYGSGSARNPYGVPLHQ
jgi:Tol biopolymer transport system component